MKRFLLILSLLICLNVKAAEMLDVDYNFIDSAFDNVKPVTNQQFDKAIEQLTPAPMPETFWGRFKAYLFGRKSVADTKKNTTLQNKEVEKIDEKAIINELQNGIFYIKLVVSVIGQDGKIIPLGNYKIQQQVIDNQKMLAFFQGSKMYGMLKLNQFEDNLKNENDISYSRVDIISDNIVRIVYSTISETQCAFAKVYLQN